MPGMISSLAGFADTMLYLLIFLFVLFKDLVYGFPARVLQGSPAPVIRNAPLVPVSIFLHIGID